MAELDVAIVGAGFAGLSAALVLARHGLHVTVVEATEQVGGRARTIHAHTGIPAELGPEYVHGEPEITLRLLGEAGLEREKLADRHHLRRDGRLVAQPSVWDRFAKLLRHAPSEKRDISARDYMLRERMHGDDAAMFAMLVEGFYAAPLSDISIASIAADASGASTQDEGDAPQTRLATGYGPLAAWMRDTIERAGGEFRYRTVVCAVDWRELRARIVTAHGEVRARRVIVTVPLGVLLARDGTGIQFYPALGDHARALSGLAMGQVVKAVACMREPVWERYAPAALEFVHSADGAAFPTYWIRRKGRAHQLTAWAGGPHARALVGIDVHGLAARMVDGFAAAIGMPSGELEDAVAHVHHHDYASDPFARGAYSYTRVGGSACAAQLAKPLGDTLYLAGEATDAEYEGSIAGALISGERAASQILERIGMRRAA